ncbi:glutathione S-transferase family protein [Paraglaciecola polaris]|uniref:Glutathione S-transferase 2 n=1 Tax=Paraglaciecola polaris LMG 21857 TaxID=1129793 RepID=K6ZP84_9ALTE|nr:glutathione S-transferase N-terminal domain-containing protein [Paraglaciecola polaris]GAC32102.1 glutathione S-transferase 2 [Paraglaciecola polaris LMG 21857]
MIIYDVENFPNPLRVRIALAEKNALDTVTFKPVDLMNAEHRSDAFLAKNPFAGVPVLELDDGTFIAECPAITEYIDHHFAGPALETDQHKEWGQKQHTRALKGLEYFDSVLAKTTYVAGDAFTVADITLWCGLVFGGFCNVTIPASLIHLQSWHDRVAIRPSITV